MVVSTNFYGLKEKDANWLIKIMIAGIILEAGCLGFHLAHDHTRSKEGKAAFEQEDNVRLLKVEHVSGRHGDNEYAYFDVNGNMADYEYYGHASKVDKDQVGRKASGVDFMKSNPNLIVYKSSGKLK